MNRFGLEGIRGCFEGIVPALIATGDPDGVPNVTYVSHVHWVDSGHVAVSHQFFNKTRRNVQANPRVAVEVVEPTLGEMFRLDLEYERT